MSDRAPLAACANTALVVAAAFLVGCGGPADTNAGPSCTYPDAGLVNHLGSIATDGGCMSCGDFSGGGNGDEDCTGEYGDRLTSGCRAYCRDGACWRHCAGECYYTPDAGGCTPGDFSCRLSWQLQVCDPSCGSNGGCRPCIDDVECEAELGTGAICQRHYGNCCQPSDVPGTDGGFSCSCI